jgi:hypothetical protein
MGLKLSNQIGLIQSVSQCIKDAEGTAEVIKEQIPRLRARSRKEQSKRSLEFFEAVIYHLKRLQELESAK